MKGWAAPELRDVLKRALALCDQVGTPAQRAQVLYGLQSLYVVESRLEKVQSTYEEMCQLFLQTQGVLPQFAGFLHTGTRMHMGCLSRARQGFETILADHNHEQSNDLQTSQGVNLLAHGYAWYAHDLWLLGFPETALQYALEGVRVASESAQPFNQALTATYLATLQEFRSDTAEFHAKAEEALALSQESRAPYYQAWSRILVAFAAASDHPTVAHLTRFEEAIHAFTGTGARLRMPYYLSLLARAYHQAGEEEKALKVIDQALREALNNQERCWDAELYRLRGVFLLSLGKNSTDNLAFAEMALLHSLEIARKQQALIYELRAAIRLARLWEMKNRSHEGRELLLPILKRFTETQDSQEIQSARSLLGIPL